VQGSKTHRDDHSIIQQIVNKTRPMPEQPKTAAPTAPRRQRLAPAARAGQILDTAARLLMDEGFTEVSMERLGREAGISKALVYNYFPNRNDLLRALLEREMALLQESQAVAVKTAESFEDLVRRTTRLYIENMQQRGALLRKLWAEPAVAGSLADENLRSRDKAMTYFARRVAREYGLPQDVALSAVDMQMAMTEAAAQHLQRSHDDVDFATDICVTLLLGGMAALSRRHAKAEAAARATRAAKTARRSAAKAGKA
jgi:TetR/AcrR family transcriptional regulator, fatty acid biosynthesis regulator